MKIIVRAAISVLTLGIASANAQSLTPSSYGNLSHAAPAYSSDVAGK